MCIHIYMCTYCCQCLSVYLSIYKRSGLVTKQSNIKHWLLIAKAATRAASYLNSVSPSPSRVVVVMKAAHSVWCIKESIPLPSWETLVLSRGAGLLLIHPPRETE